MSNKTFLPILSITGSDGTGGSGIQADIKTISTLGGYALTVITAVTVQDTRGIQSLHPMTTDIVSNQLESVIADMRPHAVKIGMFCNKETVRATAQQVVALHHIVLDTAFLSSRGEKLSSDDVIHEVSKRIMPMCEVVVMKKSEAAELTHKPIENNDDLKAAAHTLLQKYGMESIIIQGGPCHDKYLSDLLLIKEENSPHYFTKYANETQNTHGLAGTLSSAIATFLAKGESILLAVASAYQYIRTLMVYSVHSTLGHKAALLEHGQKNNTVSPRQQEIYNEFVQMIINHCRTQHNIQFYANELNITPRYLAQITMLVSNHTPKQILFDYIIHESEKELRSTTLSIQEIAFGFGFTSQAQFCNFFKKLKGCSPKSLRYS